MRLCAMTGKVDVATLLIDAGADVNAKDKDGKTPLMVCIFNKLCASMFLMKERCFNIQFKIVSLIYFCPMD